METPYIDWKLKLGKLPIKYAKKETFMVTGEKKVRKSEDQIWSPKISIKRVHAKKKWEKE